MNSVNNFLAWGPESPDFTPIVSMTSNLELSVWAVEAPDFAPVEDVDESFITERRRVYIF